MLLLFLALCHPPFSSLQIKLPLQHPPPCLGYFFLHLGHGQAIFNMLKVTLKIAKEATTQGVEETEAEGSSQIQDLLKDILKIMDSKCHFHQYCRKLQDDF